MKADFLQILAMLITPLYLDYFEVLTDTEKLPRTEGHTNRLKLQYPLCTPTSHILAGYPPAIYYIIYSNSLVMT